MSGFLRRRLVQPILDLLRQGITPEKIALSIALGITLGVTPVIGSTSILCFVAALLLGLNLPAIQLVNYFVYPLQLALLIPFLQTGTHIFGGSAVDFSLGQIFHLIRTDVWRALAILWTATLRAMLLWLIASPIVAAAIYFVLAPALRRLAEAIQQRSATAPLPTTASRASQPRPLGPSGSGPGPGN